MAKNDRDLMEHVHEAIARVPGWARLDDVYRQVYGGAPTAAQITAVNAALSALRAAGAIERVGDAYRQIAATPGGKRA